MPETFSEFVRALPEEVHGEATYSAGLPEAYRLARGAGHPFDDLVSHVRTTLRRGGGLGLVVVQLRRLAAHGPAVRPGGGREVKLPPNTVTTFPGAHPFHPSAADEVFCATCKLPSYNRHHVGHVEQAGESTVGALISEQRDRRDAAPPPEDVAERRMLLRQIERGGYSPDGAEDAMRKLIAHQNNPTSTPDDPWGAL